MSIKALPYKDFTIHGFDITQSIFVENCVCVYMS